MTENSDMKSYSLYLYTILFAIKLANCTGKNEICDARGTAKNIREITKKFEHLSLPQKRKIKEWLSEKTLEENLAAYNVTELVKDMHLQLCVIVEIGEGFCSLFVETGNATGYSNCSGNTSNTQELFIGVCTCSEIHKWRFCSLQLETARTKDCTFNEATGTQENSARVHRRLCDITQMIQWNTCNCSQSINDQILLQTEGFPSFYRAPISKSVCYPQSVCGTSKCTPTLLTSNVRSVECDPECPGSQPFCERPVFPTSVAPQVNSSWSNWDEPKCNATCGKGFLVSRATCLDKQGNSALDCIGPWKSCCPATMSPCSCQVSVVNGTLVGTRTLGPCSAAPKQDTPEPPAAETDNSAEEYTKPPQNETIQSLETIGGAVNNAKRLGAELTEKMLDYFTGSVRAIPGISGNIRAKDKINEDKRKKLVHREVAEHGGFKGRGKRQRRPAKKRRRKRDVSEPKYRTRRLLGWKKRHGEYEYEDESRNCDAAADVYKRDCNPSPTPSDDWNDEDAEIEIQEDSNPTPITTVEVAAVTEEIPVTTRTRTSTIKKTTKPLKQVKDIDEEEVEEDKGQENEHDARKADQESQELSDDSEFDISEKPATDVKQGAAKVKGKTLPIPKAMHAKKKSGKGIGDHKSKMRQPEYLEGEEGEEEVEEDPGQRTELEKMRGEGAGGESEEISDDLQMDDDAGQDEDDPNAAPWEALYKSKASLRLADWTLVACASITLLLRKLFVYQ